MSRHEFFQSLSRYCRIEELRRIQKAYWFSKNVHRPQQRDSGERYFEHPLRVAKTIISLGYREVDTIITALLHDVVEDTYTPDHVIIDLFGPSVWQNITLLSKSRPVLDPVTLEFIGKVKADPDKYFTAIMEANKAVRLVKVADRVDNTTDLVKFDEERKKRYIDETVKHIIPIAEITDPALVHMLKLNMEGVPHYEMASI